MTPADTAHALRVGPSVLQPPTGDGPLDGLNFVVKDLFAVAGHHTAAGSPDRLTDAFLATNNAAALDRVLANGATLVGIAHQDELAYSLMGQNARFPNPTNPRAPRAITGGSSSGSVAAVAAGTVPFSLGSDTGGSVRVPASYCGVPSVRPTHGRVSMDGVVPIAPSLDTVGWFAKDVTLLTTVGNVLLDGPGHTPTLRELRVPRDVLTLVDADVADVIRSAANRIARQLGVPINDTPLARTHDLATYAKTFVTLQGFEIWQSYGPWVTDAKPTLGAGTKQRLAYAATITRDQHAAAVPVRDACRRDVTACVTDALLLLPGAVSRAPDASITEPDATQLRTRLLQLTAPPGLAGVPCVTVDATPNEAFPIGMTFVGSQHSDEALLDVVAQLV